MKILFGIFGIDESCKYVFDGFEDHEVVYFLPHETNIIPDTNKIIYDYSQENFFDILAKMPSDFIPDVVILWSPEYTGIPLSLEESPYPIFGIIGDWNTNFSHIKDIINCFDYCFVSDPKGVEVLQKYGYQTIEYMSVWGVNPKSHYKIDNTDKIYDVLFIGNLNSDLQKDRALWLKRLAKLSDKYNIKILTGIHGYDYTLALNHSKITFNRSITGTINMRVYEAAACNSLLFYEEENLHIREIFQDRKHCVLYNANNFEELIEYYLTHDDKREIICNNAYSEIQKYTYKNQINKIIDRIQELIPSLDISKREFKELPELNKHNIRATQAIPTMTPKAYVYALSELQKALANNPTDILTLNNIVCISTECNSEQSINILKNSLNIPIITNYDRENIFKFDNLNYNYFDHNYNHTAGNERAVEIPIIMNFVNKYRDKDILEVGNVLSHYFDFPHDIVDKYEQADGVINEDVIDYKPDKKYDLIIAISTLEHVGWDEDIKDVDKIPVAVSHLKSLLKEEGQLIFTIPVGYNHNLDNLLQEKKIQFTKLYFFRRLGYTKWLQVDENDFSYDVTFGKPFPWSANALIFAIIDNTESPSKINIMPLFNLANLCMLIDKKSEAIEYFNKLIADLKNKPDEIRFEGLFYYFKYDYFKVEWEKCHFDNINTKDTRKSKIDLILYESYRKLGDLYYSLQDYTKATEALKNAVNYRPDGYLAYKKLSEAYSHKANYDKAIQNLERAIELYPLEPEYWKNLIELYIAANKDYKIFLEECMIILQAIPHLKKYLNILEKYKSKLKCTLYQPYKCFIMPHYDIDQAIKEFNIKTTDRVLDIGGGDAPFERADVVTELYLEDNSHRLGRTIKKDKKYVKCNVEKLPFGDKEFDFVYCNHVLEHTDYPDKACNELMRVSKNGYIEVPAYWGEYVFSDDVHKWFIYWIDNTLVFKRKPYIQKDEFNTPFDGIIHHWWEIQQRMDFVGNWQLYYRNFWTIQVLWKDKFNFKVIDDCEYDNTLESLLQDYSDLQYQNETIQFPLKNAFGNNYPSFAINKLINIFNIKANDKVLAIGDNEYLKQFHELNNVTSFEISPFEKWGMGDLKDKKIYMDSKNNKLPFKNKEFDFVFVNDILVNTSNPVSLCDEIKRVAKRGFIELPNAWTEFMFKETNNKWFVENINNKLHFHSKNIVNSPFNEILYKEYLQNDILKNQYDILYRNLTRIQFYWEDSFEYTIITHPQDIKTDFSLLWDGYFTYPTGFGDEARNFVTAIKTNFDKTNIKIINTMEVKTNLQPDKNDYLSDDIKSLTDTVIKPPVISLQHIMPNTFSRYGACVLNIGRTMFETDSLPKDAVKCCNKMDEIWVPSDFNLESFALAGVDYRKLFKVPGTIDLNLFNPETTAPLDIPEIKNEFVFLSTFDFQNRKGWDILIKAFIEEFTGQDDVVLLLKISGFDPDLTLEIIREKIFSLISDTNKNYKDSKTPQIILLDQFLSNKEYPELYKAAHCYVMPSRGEGWGRPYMEAMAMELPVIGTNWSANLEFMNIENSFLIDCSVVEIPKEEKIFHGQKWAEPDFNHLKSLMRHVYEHYELAKIKGTIARQDIGRKYSYNKISRIMMNRLNHLLESKKGIEDKLYWNIYYEGETSKNINMEHFKTLTSFKSINWSWKFRDSKVKLPPNIPYLNKYLYSIDFIISNTDHISDMFPDGHWILVYENSKVLAQAHLLNSLVDKIWVMAPYLKKELIKNGINKEKIEYMQFGIPEFDVKEIKKKTKVQFLFIGEMSWNKGIDILIKAYCNAFSNKDDVVLVIKNTSPYQTEKFNISGLLKELNRTRDDIAEIEIKESNQYEEIDELYQNSDFIVYPYRIEENFRWILKAMSANLPVIITDSFMNEGICDAQNSYLIHSNKKYIISSDKISFDYCESDIDHLTSVFKDILAKEMDFNQQTNNARSHVLNNFSVSKYSEKMINSLKEIKLKPIERFRDKIISEYVNKGIKLFSDNKFIDAEAEFTQALKFDKKDWGILHNLLFTYLYQNKLDGFKNTLIKLILLNNESTFTDELFSLSETEKFKDKLSLYIPKRVFVCDNQFHDLLNLDDKRLFFTNSMTKSPYSRIWNINNLNGFPDKKAMSNIIKLSEEDEISDEWINLTNQANEIWISTKKQKQELIGYGYDKQNILYIPILVNSDIFKNQQPMALEQKSEFNLLFIWDTYCDSNWKAILASYFESFTPEQKITLFIKVYPAEKMQDVLSQIEEFATKNNYDLENIPDIVILEEDISHKQLPALLEVMDGVISTLSDSVENYYSLLTRFMNIPLLKFNGIKEFKNQLLNAYNDKNKILDENMPSTHKLLVRHDYRFLQKHIINQLLIKPIKALDMDDYTKEVH